MAFPLLGNSDHVVVSVSIDFPINSKQDAPFYCMAYDYSGADWGDHLRDVPWEDIFKLGASVAARKAIKLIKQKYLLKTFLRTLIYITLVSLYLFSLLELI